MPTFKLDDLNPCNTFERRLLQFLAEGGTLPISVEHKAVDFAPLEARLEALETAPKAEAVRVPDDLEKRMALLEKHLLEQEAVIQSLIQAHADGRATLTFVLENGLSRFPREKA